MKGEERRLWHRHVTGGSCRKEGDGNRSVMEEEGKGKEEVVGQDDGRSLEGTIGGGRVRPSGLEANLIVHRVIDPT